MKTLIAIVSILVIAGCGWLYWEHTRPVEVKYQTAEVTRGDITQSVSATGTLDSVVSVTVGSQISGNIIKLYADFNSAVKANEVVAELDPAPFMASLHQAQGNVAFAKSALELAQLTADRKQELVKEHAAAQADMDTAVAALHQAQATLQIQQANEEMAQINLNHCTISSPIDGIVISRSVDVGQTVAASLNAPVLFTLAGDLRNMQIDSSIAEGDVGQLTSGQAVNFNVDAFPSRTFHGKVAEVRNAPVTVQNVVTYDAVVTVDNEDLKLKPGMTANMFVVIAERTDALKIPNAALRFRPPDAEGKSSPADGDAHAGGGGGGHGGGGGSGAGGGGSPKPKGGGGGGGGAGAHGGVHTIYVLPAGETKPRPVQVKLGISDGIYTEVTDGLKEGDTVVESIISGGTAQTQAGGGGGGFGMRRPF